MIQGVVTMTILGFSELEKLPEKHPSGCNHQNSPLSLHPMGIKKIHF